MEEPAVRLDDEAGGLEHGADGGHVLCRGDVLAKVGRRSGRASLHRGGRKDEDEEDGKGFHRRVAR